MGFGQGQKSSDPVFFKIADPVYRFSIRNITTTTTTGSFFLIFQIVNFYTDLQAISRRSRISSKYNDLTPNHVTQLTLTAATRKSPNDLYTS